MTKLYMLRPNWPDTFRRSVAGKMLVFDPGVPVGIATRNLALIQKDIDKGAIVPVTVDAKGRPHIVRNEEPPTPEEPPVDDQPDATAGHGE